MKNKLNQPDVEQSTTLEPNTSMTIKSPIIKDGYRQYENYCPHCKCHITILGNYCPNCGKPINWGHNNVETTTLPYKKVLVQSDPTIEEVKKEWEDDGYEVEVFKESLTIQTTPRCYVPLRDMDYHKNQRFKRISISLYPRNIFYKANYIDNDEPCYLTLKEHTRLTKTFRALKWKV